MGMKLTTEQIAQNSAIFFIAMMGWMK